MNKEQRINSNRILSLDMSPNYSCSTITIKESFLNNNDFEMDYSLSMWDDYSFNAFLMDYDDIDKISFSFDINHPLYFPFLHLLGDNSCLKIDDDNTLELEKKYLEIKKDGNDIKMSFINRLDNDELNYEKFNIFIKNICFDGRSKIDQQYKDTKERLNNFFSEVIQTLTEDYHQTTIEEYIVKQKVLQKNKGVLYMDNIRNIITKEIGNNIPVVHYKNIGNVDSIIEWIKWLEYQPSFQKETKERLCSKDANELSYDELNTLMKYSYEERMAELFKKYKETTCNHYEYMEVYNYMYNNIVDLMEQKLTSEELKEAQKKIKKLKIISHEELNKTIQEEQKEENYKKLSMVDAYVLHMMSDINFARNISELNKKIAATQEATERNKNLEYTKK